MPVRMMVKFWILDSGYWILDTGFWILGAGFIKLNIFYYPSFKKSKNICKIIIEIFQKTYYVIPILRFKEDGNA